MLLLSLRPVTVLSSVHWQAVAALVSRVRAQQAPPQPGSSSARRSSRHASIGALGPRPGPRHRTRSLNHDSMIIKINTH